MTIRKATPLTRRMLTGLVLATLALPFNHSTQAQTDTFPNRPIRLQVGYAAGGGIDAVSRIVAEEVSKLLPQRIVVENRAGAGGTIASDFVAKSEPDGHILMTAAAGSTVISPHLKKDMTYRIEDFTGVTLLGAGPLLIIVSATSPIKDLADLIKRAKAAPGTITYGSPGVGTSNHTAALMFEQAAGIKLQHIPYKGPEANMDLLAGRIDLVFDALTTATPFIKDGRVRAIAITTKQRNSDLPSVPTIAESGFPGFDASNWYGIVAPAKTPSATIEKLNAAFLAALRDPTVKAKLNTIGFTVAGTSAAEFNDFLKSQYEKMGAAIRAANITPE
jgi:tripartite-type tricarboxylate transporter receptor subunit TctC